MNRNQLHHFLLEHNTRPAPDWNELLLRYEPEHTTIKGQQVYWFDWNLDTMNTPIQDSIVIAQHIPGSFMPLHMHHYIKLIYVYRGQCRIALQHHSDLVLSEGDLLLIDKQTPHAIRDISDEDIVMDIKLKQDYLSSGFLNRFANKNTTSQFLIHSLIDNRRANSYLHFSFHPESNIRETMERILCEYFERDFCSADLIDSYCFALFTELLRYSGTGRQRSMQLQPKDALVLDFLHYIEQHHRECSLVEMAEHFGYHPNYISAFLKKETGRSFMDLLQIERLNKAALYLTHSDMPIPSIAEEVGYSSASFFHKKFKEMFTSTPSHYREQARM
ncbi:AraC family transcriptional regulator [Paenibacillus sp. WLX1005]|uniref:AraC family transcriptional regulator n=1 Tax=Paenibacillus sp. WLX1005 TaxID=3243766 RepID=UPI0039845765